MKIAISGAHGYLGKALSDHFAQQGHTLVRLQRNDCPLQQPTIEKIGENCQTFIHCAYDMSLSTWEDICRVNIQGTTKLFALLAEKKIPQVIFISTLSAYPACHSNYGRAKYQLEQEALARGFLVLRPGLIYGGEQRGLIGKLKKICGGRSLLPLIGSGRQVQYTTFLPDLLAFISEAVASELGSPQAISAAHPRGLTFRTILASLSGRKQILFIPIPWPLVWFALFLLERMGLRPPFASDSVLGLVYPTTSADFSSPFCLEKFRPWSA